MNNYKTEDEYLESVRNSGNKHLSPQPLYEAHFDFGSVPFGVYVRFAELLPPPTLHFFRKTCKTNYSSCLNYRGIQVQQLLVSTDCDQAHGCFDTQSGHWRLNLDDVQADWIQNLVVTGSVSVPNPYKNTEKFTFVQKYTQLTLRECDWQLVQKLIHPKLEKINVFLQCF